MTSLQPNLLEEVRQRLAAAVAAVDPALLPVLTSFAWRAETVRTP